MGAEPIFLPIPSLCPLPSCHLLPASLSSACVLGHHGSLTRKAAEAATSYLGHVLCPVLAGGPGPWDRAPQAPFCWPLAVMSHGLSSLSFSSAAELGEDR